MIEISRVENRVVALDKWLSPVVVLLCFWIAIACWSTPVHSSDRSEVVNSGLEGLVPQVIEAEPAVIKDAVPTKDLHCLAQNIYHEAGAESKLGKLAVGVVTINRLYDKRFPSTVCGVVKQSSGRSCQFSWVCAGKKAPSDNPAWRESMNIAKMLLAGGYDQVQHQFNGAKFFHASAIKTDWSRRLAKVGQIGGHVFYR